MLGLPGWLLPVLAGPFIGSFLGVLVRRLPEGRPIAAARSCCEACGHTLSAAELIPLVSFAWQRGRCRSCGARIAWAHPAIELAASAVAILAACAVPAGAWPGGVYLWLGCVLGWWLLTLAWIDAQTYLLPDVLTLPLVLAGLAEAWWLERGTIFDRADAAALAATCLYALAFVYRRLRGRDGLGEGDAKLLAAGGAWVGLAALPWVMIGGASLALGYAGYLRLRGVALSGTTKIPFGPFLAAGIWIVWLAAWVE
jgi:leader peptidase (prepilin peptidase)/N-methyltransferase